MAGTKVPAFMPVRMKRYATSVRKKMTTRRRISEPPRITRAS